MKKIWKKFWKKYLTSVNKYGIILKCISGIGDSYAQKQGDGCCSLVLMQIQNASDAEQRATMFRSAANANCEIELCGVPHSGTPHSSDSSNEQRSFERFAICH